MYDISYFARSLRYYRKKQGMTQWEFADALDVSAQSVSGWECGKSMPDVEHLCRIANLFELSVDVLLRENVRIAARGLIGIDAGGTKTEFALIDEFGNKVSSVILAGSNPNACGVEETIRIVKKGVDQLLPQAEQTLGIFLGGAGFEIEEYAERMRTALQKVYPNIAIGCANDIMNVIACCSAPDRCVAAIGGTGCIVYSSCAGQVRRVGGVGYLFERYGSGYNIGQEAITAALWAEDGIEEQTLLSSLVKEKLGDAPIDHLKELYQKGVSYIAGFAPLVFQAAQQNDPRAQDILERNSAHMAKMIQTALGHMPDIRNVVFSGSLFSKTDVFFQNVTQRLDPGLTFERITYPPVWGACLQCAKLCGLDTMPSLDNFLK